MKSLRTTLMMMLFLSCGQQEGQVQHEQQPQTKELQIGDYAFDFNSNFQIGWDTTKANTGFIKGQGISINYIGGWIPREQLKVIEDTSTVVVETDTVMNLFRKIVYSKDSSNGGISIILSSITDLADTSGLFPNTFIGLLMQATELNKQQQNELLKIFKTGRLKSKV